MLTAIAATMLCALAAEAADSPPSQPGAAAASAAPVAPVPAQEAPSSVATPAPAVVAAGPAAAATPAAAASGSDASGSIVLSLSTVPAPADFKPPPGYKAVKRGLDTVYCTSVTRVGSRMPEKVCMSREELEEVARQSEISRRTIKEKVRGAGGTSGG